MARQGFGIFNSTEAGGYGMGWCPHCGRRRGTDGRCNDCDPWYTSPLVQYGGPIVAMFAVFLIAGAMILRSQGAQASDPTPAGGAVLAATSTTAYAMPLNAPVYQPIVQSAIPAMPKPPNPATLVASFAPGGYSPDAQQYQNLENLRQTTAWVDAQVSAERFRREQEARQEMLNSGGGRALIRSQSAALAASDAEVF